MVTETTPTDAGAGVERLDDLVDAAQAIEQPKPAPGEPTPQAQAAQATADNAAELLIALQIVRDMTLPLLAVLNMDEAKVQRLTQIWADPALQRIADAGASVMERHGIVMSDVLGQYGPYIGLAAAALPPTIATVAITRKPKATDGQQQPA